MEVKYFREEGISQTKDNIEDFKPQPLELFRRSFLQLDEFGNTSVKLCSCQPTPDNHTPDDIITQRCAQCSDVGTAGLLPQTTNPEPRQLSFKDPVPVLPSQSSVETVESVKEPYRREASGSQVPIAGALFIATCVGSPVTALAGLKLGMFAAVGGAIMGFATGKMFAEHEEKQAQAKGEFSDDEGNIPSHIKKKKTIKRIQEWERFERNCQLLKELDDEKLSEISKLHKEKRTRSMGNVHQEVYDRRSNLRKAKSVEQQLSPCDNPKLCC